MNKIILFFAIVSAFTFSAFSQNFEAEGINYKITSSVEPYSVEVTKKSPQYNGSITIPETAESGGITYSVTSVGFEAFQWASSLQSVTLPNSVLTIQERAFNNCRALQTVNLSSSLTSIGREAFADCQAMASIALPSSLQTIEENAFQYCKALTAIVIPNSVTSMGMNVFAECDKLVSVSLSNSLSKISDRCFERCIRLSSVSIPSSVTEIGSGAFNDCSELTDISIPDGVITIKGEAFARCSSLTSVILPNSVTSLGWYVFSECTNLTSVTLPNLITSLPYRFFYNCNKLTDLDIPATVKYIGEWAFYQCYALLALELPAAVTTIDETAFQKCTGIAHIKSYAATPPTAYLSSFSGVSYSIPLYVPEGSVQAYKDAFIWENFTNITALNLSEETNLSAGDENVKVGDNCSLSILSGEIRESDNIIAYQFDLSFDPLLVGYTGYELSGTLSEGGLVDVHSPEAGKLSVSFMSEAALSGMGALIKLQFSGLKTGNSAISLSNAFFNETGIPVLSDGSITITDNVPPVASISYDDTENRYADILLITANFSEEMNPSDEVHLNFTGAVNVDALVMSRISSTEYRFEYSIPDSYGEVIVSLSNGTDLNGNEVVSQPAAGRSFSIVELILGDISDNKSVTAYDAALCLQKSVGLDPVPDIDPLPWENWRDTTANVDKRDGITATDAGLILSYSSGKITSFSESSKKSFENAGIRINFNNNELLFYPSGNVIGINLISDEGNEYLGDPVFYSDKILFATNINEDNYRLGLCSADILPEDVPLFSIPVNDPGGLVSFQLLVNETKSLETFNLITGDSPLTVNEIRVFPNPAVEGFYISIDKVLGSTAFFYRLINQQGCVIDAGSLLQEKNEIMLDPGAAKGIYYVQVGSVDGIILTEKLIIE